MGGRGSKSDSECDCCSECAALHEFDSTWVQRPRIKRLHSNANAHQQAGCRSHSLYNGSEYLRFNLENELSFPGPGANECDSLIHKSAEAEAEANFPPPGVNVDLLSVQSSSPIRTPKQRSKLLIEKAKLRAEKPKFRMPSKSVGKKNVFFQSAIPCEDENSYKFHTPRQTPWSAYLRHGVFQQCMSSEDGVTSSASATASASLCFKGTYKGFLTHECRRCITEQDMMSLFEFERLERECDAACMMRTPPVPKARKTRMIQQTSAQIVAQDSIA